jgi:hypothetical protein
VLKLSVTFHNAFYDGQVAGVPIVVRADPRDRGCQVAQVVDLVEYLCGVTSERRLCEEVQMHVGYRIILLFRRTGMRGSLRAMFFKSLLMRL